MAAAGTIESRAVYASLDLRVSSSSSLRSEGNQGSAGCVVSDKPERYHPDMSSLALTSSGFTGKIGALALDVFPAALSDRWVVRCWAGAKTSKPFSKLEHDGAWLLSERRIEPSTIVWLSKRVHGHSQGGESPLFCGYCFQDCWGRNVARRWRSRRFSTSVRDGRDDGVLCRASERSTGVDQKHPPGDDSPNSKTTETRPGSSRTLKLTSRGIVWSDDEVEQVIVRSQARVGRWHGDMVRWRRQIHSFPELAFLEKATSSLVEDLLLQWGYSVHRGLGGTGVVATLTVGDSTDGGSGAIMLRADMDALPIHEESDFAYRSTQRGVMHACGHDGHTAMLLGAARLLSETRKFRGTVHLLFQPAEEGTLTENEGKRVNGGALAMLNEGLLEKFPVRAAFAMHNWPGVPVGRFAIHSGPVMAAVDNFHVTVNGLGCHAGMPHLGQGQDAVLCAAHTVTALQSLVSRSVDPQDSAVVSVTQIHGGDANNVIPGCVTLKGTMRTFKETTRTYLMDRFCQIVQNTASAFGCAATVEFADHFPATINTAGEARLCLQVARKIVGDDRAEMDKLPPSMGAEDFGYILQRVPGCYLWIGNGPTEGGCMLHNPKYDFNDDCLAIGAAFWVELVETLLPVGSGL
ncbi:hypothetical protein CBR_g28088 [Chara braunii]|uniref:Peptidase M20 dimerisation domain-containing protein n=1 Tax=Chara braunii TaxID=69332 RepID=A0A388L9J7_CHABU|nr:hypothetical protein CBR_g28088 [Chara braunii]|eukprot:GBG78863.1 hypothetical protein CBR_g28088 [Chara braunii]